MIRGLVEEVLGQLSGRFAELYSGTGRPSIPPEQMLKATLLQAFFSIRSERQLMEQMDYNLLFRWFVGLDMDARVWDASTFSKNRDRLLEADVAREFLTTLTHATVTAERDAALTMIDRTCKPGRRVTLAGDKLFDASSFVTALRTRKVTPHIAVNGTVSKLGKVRKTLIDKRTTRHEGYAVSLRVRKRIEEAFGWAKTIGGMAKLKVRGLARAEAAFTFRLIAYNLIRLPKLLEAG